MLLPRSIVERYLAKMVFTAPSWCPQLPFDPPDSIPICDFVFDEHYGRHPLGYSKSPFTCGLSGKTYSALEVKERVDYLARGLAKELGFKPNEGTEWDKVIAVFSLNTVSQPWFHSVNGRVLMISSSTRCLWHGRRTVSEGSRRPPMPRTAPRSSNTSCRIRAPKPSSPASLFLRPRKKLRRK